MSVNNPTVPKAKAQHKQSTNSENEQYVVQPQEELDNGYGDTYSVMHLQKPSESPIARERRSKLLSNLIRDDNVRRICRRAGVSSYATSAPVGEGIVRHALEQITNYDS